MGPVDACEADYLAERSAIRWEGCGCKDWAAAEAGARDDWARKCLITQNDTKAATLAQDERKELPKVRTRGAK